MIGTVKSLKINPSGYECSLGLYIDKIGIIYCYLPLISFKDPYGNINKVDILNSNGEEFNIKINDKLQGNLKIVFITDYKLINDDYELITFNQPIKDSPHTICTASVTRIIDGYTLLASINGLGENILLETECKVSNLKIGIKIEFSGEISFNIDKKV